jgi:hypothetical protein
MSEPEPEEAVGEAEGTHPVSDPDAELERRNMQFGWALAALFVVLFAGTFGIAFAYNWLS